MRDARPSVARIVAACTVVLLAVALGACSLRRPAGSDFDTHWHDGRAELDGYHMSVVRYGHVRPARAVAIYVTEPFSASRRVKLDDPSADSADVVDVLKLNLVRDFQTGIYDYHTVLSLFMRTADFDPVKLAFSCSEWCGQVYEEMRFDRDTIGDVRYSYFDGESGTQTLDRPAGGIDEDQLFVLLRNLRGEFLAPDGVITLPFLPSPFVRRLTHTPLEWISASIRRGRPERIVVPGGRFTADVYEVRTSDGRIGVFHVEREAPRRVVRWSWVTLGDSTSDATETAELAGTERLPYWKLNGPGGERMLRRLGLSPAIR